MESNIVVHQWLCNVDGDGESLKQCSSFRTHLAPIDEAPTSRFSPHENVLCNRAEWDEVDFLIDGADPIILCLLWSLEINSTAIENNITAITTMGASEDF